MAEGLGHDRRGDRFINVYAGPDGKQFLGEAWHSRWTALRQHSTDGETSAYRRVAMLHVRPKEASDAQPV